MKGLDSPRARRKGVILDLFTSKRRNQTNAFHRQDFISRKRIGVLDVRQLHDGRHEVNNMPALPFLLSRPFDSLWPMGNERRQNSALVIEMLIQPKAYCSMRPIASPHDA